MILDTIGFLLARIFVKMHSIIEKMFSKKPHIQFCIEKSLNTLISSKKYKISGIYTDFEILLLKQLQKLPYKIAVLIIWLYKN